MQYLVKIGVNSIARAWGVVRFGRVRDKCLLQVQVTKTEVFTWQDNLPVCTPWGMKREGAQAGDQWLCLLWHTGGHQWVREADAEWQGAESEGVSEHGQGSAGGGRWAGYVEHP